MFRLIPDQLFSVFYFTLFFIVSFCYFPGMYETQSSVSHVTLMLQKLYGLYLANLIFQHTYLHLKFSINIIIIIINIKSYPRSISSFQAS